MQAIVHLPQPVIARVHGVAYDYTRAVMAKNLQAQHAQEGLDAFLSKRQPVWRGQ
ncbi:hypothetical protein [Rhodopseudomonas infernalis]|uniref:hypothetical protein n=1 Tax=Rhodopseudomonas infernalis TaxID=2897386 RepID=UPI001EE95ACA|nr:hypothetical protein [Rhodopseudomonas infernalis]